MGFADDCSASGVKGLACCRKIVCVKIQKSPDRSPQNVEMGIVELDRVRPDLKAESILDVT